MTDQLPNLNLEYTCEAVTLTRIRKRMKPCRRKATHMFAIEHTPMGCEPFTLATCDEHGVESAEALMQRRITLATALAEGRDMHCLFCHQPLDTISAAGNITCLHPKTNTTP